MEFETNAAGLVVPKSEPPPDPPPQPTQERWETFWVRGHHDMEVRDPEGWYSAVITNSGCIHFHRYHNVPIQNRTGEPDAEQLELDDYLHICSLDDLIARMESLRRVAKKHFGEHWGR